MALLNFKCDITNSTGELLGKLLAKERAALEQCVEEASHLALGKSYVASKPKVEREFTKLIDQFYSSYSPQYYWRSYDMYGVLDVQADEGSESFSYDWKPDAMQNYQRGGDGTLMEQTVGYGFHGGATGTDKSGDTRGVPSYRAPYLPTTGGGRYKHWGAAAASSPAPYDQFMEWLQNYFNSEEYTSLYRNYFAEAINELAPKYLSGF